MPLYQLTVERGSAGARHRAELARALTAAHAEVTGAPARYVTVTVTEVEPGSVFDAGRAVPHGRLLGIVREGRAPEVKQRLLEQLAAAWSRVTGEPVTSLGLFLVEVPGSSMLEHGQVLPEADQDRTAGAAPAPRSPGTGAPPPPEDG